MSTPAGTSSQAFIAQENQYGAHNYHPLDVVCTKGEGVYLTDVDGKKYMDFLAAYSAVNQGHNHPRIGEAMIRQIRELALTSRAFRNDQFPPLLEKLCRITGFDKALLMNSGAEAVETALKAARKWGYDKKGIEYPKAEIIVADGNFHGRTTTIVGFSTDPDSTSRFGPFTPGFRIVPYGDLEAVKAAINPNTCAIFMEPIQGEGGVVIPPKGFLKGLRDLADRNNVLLILDEIQSGLGRTGKLFAFEHEGIRPDGITIGKALSGGFYPVSAFLAKDEVMDVFTPGIHGSTYGGNPLACAVASEALDVLVDEKLVERAAELGDHLRHRLTTMKTDKLAEVRVIGLWAGVQLKPEAGGARKYCYQLKDRGMLCKDTHVDTIRLAPPLVITKAQIDWAVDQLEAVLA
ncbi:ornithine--oxo-acid transaminase [Mesoterricola sediminis]|uniref:ornithine aminotransferase n=1 Tax=Mesoterricola sediminis TaxID=2927980 RepID=A0AA48KCD0_9BACT|nr:ornithine--oxo-acid transaminase [Mesoterricola sediminis]BDU77029.1 ornithine aminotransferase [Mesoterricola sediminis]